MMTEIDGGQKDAHLRRANIQKKRLKVYNLVCFRGKLCFLKHILIYFGRKGLAEYC